jgi:hypothetical protein
LRPVHNLRVRLLTAKALRSGRGLVRIACPDAGDRQSTDEVERIPCRGCKLPILGSRSLRFQALQPGPIHTFLCSYCFEASQAVDDPRLASFASEEF